jgi:hypothetical protein
MRNWRHTATTTLVSTPVMWAGPETWPQMINDSLMFLRVRPAKGPPLDVGCDMSTMQWRRFDSVPEVVVCEADVGRMICAPVWLEMVTLVESEKGDCRIADELSCIAPAKFLLMYNSASGFSSTGDVAFTGLVMKDEFAPDVSEV